MTPAHRIIALLLVVAPVVALAGPKQEAEKHVAKATKLHADGKFDEARVELEAAYKLDPKPQLLYAIGQVDVKLGKCDDAKAAYEKFLVVTKDRQAGTVVRQAIAACKPAAPAVAQEPEPPPPEPPPPPPPPPPPEPAASPPPPPPVVAPPPPPVERTVIVTRTRSPWYRDPIGDALVVAGVASAVVGVVMYRGAVSDLDDAEASHSLAGYRDLVDSAHSRRTYAIVLTGGGAALVGAGIVTYLVRDRSHEVRVGVVPARGGGLLTWTGGF